MVNHSPTFEVFYDGAWHRADVLRKGNFSYMRGGKTYGQELDPAESNLTLDRGDIWAPKSVLSPLYGKIGQNTPGRLSIDADVRLTGEVAAWRPQRPNGGSPVTPIELGGVLRRIGRGTDPFRSPLTRAILGIQPTAFWPMDETDSATQFNDFSGGNPLLFTTGVLPGEYEDIYGMPRAAEMGTGSATAVVDASLVPAHADATWTAGFALKVTDIPSNDPRQFSPLISFNTGGNYYRWDVTLLISAFDDLTLVLKSDQGFDSTSSNHPLNGDLFDGSWHYIEYRIGFVASSNQLTVTTAIDGAQVDSGSFVPSTSVVTCGVTTVDINPWHVNFDVPFGIGAVYVKNGTPAATWAGEAINGYAGELAADRFERLLAEEGIASTVIGTAAECVAMGPQGTDPLLAQLEEIATTDDASIFETRDSLGLTMRTGASKLNQDVALTLYYNGDIVPNLVPVYGDEAIRNDVTATNPDQTQGRWVQETGPHNVQLPEDDPQGVGRYKTQLPVNTATTGGLVDAAGWRVNVGTFEGTWYAQVTVDLDAAPGLITAVNAVDIGDLVQITQLPVEDSIGDFFGLVLGIEERCEYSKRRLVTFYLMAADPYRVGVLAQTTGDTDPTVGYAETDSSVVAAGVAAGASSFTATCSPLWTTATDDFPQDVVVGGQRVAIGSVSGSSNPQTFTVYAAATPDRKIQYPIATGASITVYQPLILTL
jgi:hypothetical protein